MKNQFNALIQDIDIPPPTIQTIPHAVAAEKRHRSKLDDI